MGTALGSVLGQSSGAAFCAQRLLAATPGNGASQYRRRATVLGKRFATLIPQLGLRRNSGIHRSMRRQGVDLSPTKNQCHNAMALVDSTGERDVMT